MSPGDDCCRKPPHIALFPSAGMGHLTPSLRLAAMLASRGCTLTLITAKPTVSAAESNHISAFFSAYPQINRLEFEVLPHNTTSPTTDDPFFLQFDAINRSVHLLGPLLSSLSAPLSAIISDIIVSASFGPIVEDLGIPNYVVWTSSARFLSIITTNLSLSISQNSTKFNNENVEIIPGLSSKHPFASILVPNVRFLPKAKGLLLNTFDKFEYETITALNNGDLRVHPIGPLEPCELENGQKGHYIPWLDNQIVGSVVYISFGSRTAMSKDQIRELGIGLEMSGCPFLWVLKTGKVDKEDKEEVQEVLEESFFERTRNRGIVVKGWVKQDEILGHPSIGGFVSHCGWNSVVEAAQHGVAVLALPQQDEQRLNAEVVEKAGLGMWVKEWWRGGKRVVRGEEIGEKVREMMSERKVRERAREVGEEARKARELNGSSEKALMAIIDALKA